MDYLIGQIKTNGTYEFPEIQSTNNGRTTYWKIIVALFGPDGGPMAIKEAHLATKEAPEANVVTHIYVESKIGPNGKIKAAVPTIVAKGKNIGRSNETNVLTQALKDAYSKYKKQLQKSSEKKTEDYAGTTLWPPMLATNMIEVDSASIDFNQPIFIQPKANGVRAVATLGHQGPNEGQMATIIYSRTRHLYHGLQHIKAELFGALMARREAMNIYLDGELYLHGQGLETISGIARRELNTEAVNLKLKFYVFDLFIPEQEKMEYIDRLDLLNSIFEAAQFEYVVKMPTYRVKSMEEANEYYRQFVDDGYEGAMLRLNRPYRYSFHAYHSTNMLKMKPLFDDEFEIVGYSAGEKGKGEGALMLILRTKEGLEFPVGPNVPLGERYALLKKMSEIEDNGHSYFDNHYKGKMMNIQYEGLTKNGIPTNIKTNGIVIRDYD
jgi:ATP-dependent DNA ligase